MEKALDFLTKLCLGKPSNVRYLLALRSGGKHWSDLRASHATGRNAKLFEYMAIVGIENKIHSLTPNGRLLADALASLITVTTDIMPKGGKDDRDKTTTTLGGQAA